MDRITHQSPRQRGYGSTSSLRNDSSKHTRKHERREESNQETKLPASGGLSGQAGRTVRKGRADCPAGYRGQSAPLLRTVRPEPWTVRKRHQNHQRRTTNNGPSAGSTRTVRQAPADRPPVAADCPKPCPTKTQSHDGSRAKPSKNTKNTGRTRTSRTVRHLLADCPRLADRAETSSTSKVNLSNPSPDLPNGRSCRDKSLGT
jgi:hypothetical protein